MDTPPKGFTYNYFCEGCSLSTGENPEDHCVHQHCSKTGSHKCKHCPVYVRRTQAHQRLAARRATIICQNAILSEAYQSCRVDLGCELTTLRTSLGTPRPIFKSKGLLIHRVTGNVIASADEALVKRINVPSYAKNRVVFLRLQNPRFLTQLLFCIPKPSMDDEIILHKVDVTKGIQQINSVIFAPGEFTLHYSLKISEAGP